MPSRPLPPLPKGSKEQDLNVGKRQADGSKVYQTPSEADDESDPESYEPDEIQEIGEQLTGYKDDLTEMINRLQ